MGSYGVRRPRKDKNTSFTRSTPVAVKSVKAEAVAEAVSEAPVKTTAKKAAAPKKPSAKKAPAKKKS